MRTIYSLLSLLRLPILFLYLIGRRTSLEGNRRIHCNLTKDVYTLNGTSTKSKQTRQDKETNDSRGRDLEKKNITKFLHLALLPCLLKQTQRIDQVKDLPKLQEVDGPAIRVESSDSSDTERGHIRFRGEEGKFQTGSAISIDNVGISSDNTASYKELQGGSGNKVSQVQTLQKLEESNRKQQQEQYEQLLKQKYEEENRYVHNPTSNLEMIPVSVEKELEVDDGSRGFQNKIYKESIEISPQRGGDQNLGQYFTILFYSTSVITAIQSQLLIYL
jgi:hypothetical protein